MYISDTGVSFLRSLFLERLSLRVFCTGFEVCEEDGGVSFWYRRFEMESNVLILIP